jgi:RNA polymerase sigma-70 factor (ECF subfamily)
METVPDSGGAPTDAALVSRCAAGDRRAFDELVDRHGPALFRFASRHCGARQDAEDAVQDGLLAAWRGAATFRGEAAVRTWLFQVVIHACRRGSRRRSGEPAVHAGLEDAEGLTGEQAAGVLGLSLAAMKSRLHRGRLELKERVEASLGLAPGKGLS